MAGGAARDLLLALSDGHARSGSELAARTGVTRAAVWKQIEALRALGVPIDARAGSGYRLRAPIDLLDAAAIDAALPVPLRERFAAIDVHWQIDSTNSALLRRAATTSHELEACLAESQTQGRGRRGREWHMPLGGGLALSLRRRFDASMGTLAGLSLAVGVSLVEVLVDAGVRGAGLKWPNDVVVDGRKLAGILVELSGDALGPCHAVIGIGINVRLDAAATRAIGQPAVELATLVGAGLPSRNVLSAQVLARLVDALDEFAVHGFAAFAERFTACDVLRGRMLRILDARGARDGVALGVDAFGRLRVRGDDGEFAVDSGEVSVRVEPGTGA